jgi:hypothetical protein
LREVPLERCQITVVRPLAGSKRLVRVIHHWSLGEGTFQWASVSSLGPQLFVPDQFLFIILLVIEFFVQLIPIVLHDPGSVKMKCPQNHNPWDTNVPVQVDTGDAG